MKKAFVWLAILLVFSGSAFAAEIEWLRGGTYNPSIPTPQSVLGYEIGTYLTDHLQMVDYMNQLADSSDRVALVHYGRTYERRDLYILIISSPENMNRLETIRTAIERLTDPRKTTPSEAAVIAGETPPIGWINFGTDGNETAAFEGAMQLAYQLAAGTDPLTTKILDEVVTIINPCLSPDSHQWFTTWAKAMTIGKPGTPDPAAAEHRSPWFVSSDGNHYLIDINRDAFALSQTETQAVAETLHHWNPQIWVDNHGQPEVYHMAPFASPVNLNYPTSVLKWATEVGKNIARYFDPYGWTYVKDERYDLYYPGYWDSYPALNGAVAATYETDGGGSKGFIYERSDGSTTTLQHAIHHHFLADLATLEVLADNREAVLGDFYAFRASGMENVDREEIKQLVLLPDGDEGRVHSLVELLLRHRIEVYRTDAPLISAAAQTYFDPTPKRMEFPAGSFVVPFKQPQKRLLKALVEPEAELEEEFLKEVYAIRERNRSLGSDAAKEPLWFYDITAWALPVTYGVEAALTEDFSPLSAEWLLSEVPRTEGGVIGGEARYAYFFDYDDSGAKLAGRLLQEGYKLALATRGFTVSGREYGPGTLIVRVERNSEDLHQTIRDSASSFGAKVYTADTGWAEQGISLGSYYVKNLVEPKILVATDAPTRATTFGAVYALLDQRFGLSFSAVRTEDIAGADLSRYNVIVFPDGSAAGYQRLLGEKGVQRLESWIEEGGTFIGLKGGAAFTTREGVELTDVGLVTEVPDTEAEDEEGVKPVENLPGAIFKVELNTHYYLGIGYPEEIAVQVRGDTLFSPTEKGVNVASFPESTHLMGHKWEDTEEILSGRPYLVDVPVGQGHVILFANDPTFRAFWRGLDRLLLSAILFAPAM